MSVHRLCTSLLAPMLVTMKTALFLATHLPLSVFTISNMACWFLTCMLLVRETKYPHITADYNASGLASRPQTTFKRPTCAKVDTTMKENPHTALLRSIINAATVQVTATSLTSTPPHITRGVGLKLVFNYAFHKHELGTSLSLMLTHKDG